MAAKKDRLTFKKEKTETGLAGVGHPYPNVTIKHNGHKVGNISPASWNKDYWSVGFMVEGLNGDNQNCSWGWLFRNERFNSEQEARDFVKANEHKVLAMNLHHMDDD